MRRGRFITSREYTYTAAFEPDEHGGYVVTFPALPGCLTYGASLEEARTMAADVLQSHLETLQDDGMPVPVESHVPTAVSEKVRVQLKVV